METLCGLFDKRRQWYYEKRKVLYTEVQRVKVIIEDVEWYRMQAPRIGGVKLHVLLTEELGHEFVGGRDFFLELLRRHHLMLPKKKPRHTTDSSHVYFKYPNLTVESMVQK